MNVGDSVKVVDQWGEVAGTITTVFNLKGTTTNEIVIRTAGQRTISYYDDSPVYEIIVLRPMEPENVGSVYYDADGIGWIKYSTTVFNNWINADGLKRKWEDLT